jgi:hypothetical protein
MLDVQPCQWCREHAPVYWLRHQWTWRSAPIDAEPAPDGNIEINLELGIYRVLPKEKREGRSNLRKNHHATCSAVAKRRAEKAA